MSRFLEIEKLTPNVSAGTNERLGVVLHHTAGSFDGSVNWLTTRASKASAHVVIAKDGRRVTLAPDSAITWHAGKSAWRGRNGCNAFTLGVEFELTPDDVRDGVPLSEAQIESCLEWLTPRMAKYDWTPDDITDHRTVALPKGRKADLSPANYALAMEAIRARFGSFVDVPTVFEVTVPIGTRRIVLNLE